MPEINVVDIKKNKNKKINILQMITYQLFFSLKTIHMTNFKKVTLHMLWEVLPLKVQEYMREFLMVRLYRG